MSFIELSALLQYFFHVLSRPQSANGNPQPRENGQLSNPSNPYFVYKLLFFETPFVLVCNLYSICPPQIVG